MKRVPILMLVLATLCGFAGPAAATSTLSFEGGGFWIDFEVGDDAASTIAAVRFHENARGIVLPPGDWRLEAFDPRREVLVLRHRGGHSSVKPFVLSVHHRDALLAIDGRTINAPFSWEQ